MADADPAGLPLDQPVEEGGMTTDDFEPMDEIGVDFTFKPLSPAGQSITSLTPKYYFTRYTEVTNYKLEVRNFYSDAVVFTYPFSFPGTATCTTAYCWVQPSTSLKVWKSGSEAGGYYVWRVAAKVGTSWVWSTEVMFQVNSKGFTSTFDSNTSNWKVLSGTWTRVDPGYYKTSGVLGGTVYAQNRFYFLDNSVYEVRMKRKTEVGSRNYIYFMGIPGALSGGHWFSGYVLEYWNTNGWNLYKLSNYTPQLIYSGTSSYLEPLGWNTFKIWRNYPNIYIWFNGVYIGSFEDTFRTEGLVGIGMEEMIAGASPLLVDYAKVYYSGTAPENIPLTVDGEPDPAYRLNP